MPEPDLERWATAYAASPWFADTRRFKWADLRRTKLVGLGYHSPNMVPAHHRRLERQATASDQEAVAP
jgi:LysR family transcriptional regulator, transcriptional activator for bauABCD operon